MDEKALFMLSLAISILGIIALCIISELSGKEIPISSINKKDIGKNVVITGNIISIKEKSGITLIAIKDNGSMIDAVVFDNSAIYRDYSNLKEGGKVKVRGRVSEWKGTLQVTTDSIIPIED